ncbi:hypothetical protein ScPMuIL_015154 [Solemya velum]
MPTPTHPKLKAIYDKLRENCIRDVFSKPVPDYDDHLYCSRTYDVWGCWNDTLAGQRAFIQCPPIPGFNRNGTAFKDCTENGTWWVLPATGKDWANYSECQGVAHEDTSADHQHVYVFIGGYSVSLVLLVLSLVVFFWFRQLRCERVSIHKNLFVSYVVTGVVWIMYYSMVAVDGDVIMQNPVWCQGLHVFAQYITACNFAWMFCEGLYLHTIIAKAFLPGKKLFITCCLVGWVSPMVLTAIYASIRGNDPSQTRDCWIDESSLQWIVYGPVVISLFLNVLFLINIVRLLLTKLKTIPEASQTKKAARATLILIPLLGVQYLLFPIRPEKGSPIEDFYYLFTALFISLQGAFVSIIFCFCNGEVLAIVRRKWYQHLLMKGKDVRLSGSNMATTYVPTDQRDERSSIKMKTYSATNNEENTVFTNGSGTAI